MSRQDPGAAEGIGHYPNDPPCVCGHSAGLHNRARMGTSGGQTVRDGCALGSCGCVRYRAKGEGE